MKSLCLFLLLATVSFGWSQSSLDKSEELQKRNGFKTIKLAQHVDSVKGTSFKKEFKEKDEFPAKIYSVSHDEYSMIGEVKVTSIEIKTYKDLVYEIEVITDKDLRLMKGLEIAFGKTTYNVRTKAYHWAADSLSLTFIGNKKTQTLIYKSYPVFKKMYIDKGKKIEDIAEGF